MAKRNVEMTVRVAAFTGEPRRTNRVMVGARRYGARL